MKIKMSIPLRKKERGNKVLSFAREYKTFPEISLALSISPAFVKNKMVQIGLSPLDFQLRHPFTRSNLRPLEEIIQKGGYSPHYSVVYHGVEEGLSLKEIGRSCNLTKARAGQLIIELGLHDFWKFNVNRREKKEKSDYELNMTLWYVRRCILPLSCSNWAKEKVIKAVIASRNDFTTRNINLTQLGNMFEEYKKAKDSETPVTFKHLSGIMGFGHSLKSFAILKSIGLHSLNWSTKKYLRVTNEEINLIRDSQILFPDFTDSDINYFGNRSITTLRKYRQKEPDGVKPPINYTRASRIYKLSDLGRTSEEITADLGLSQKIVNNALKKRKSVGKRIISLLNYLHPEKNIKQPYLSGE